MLLYGGTIAIRNELAELQQSIGAASYQIRKELKACSFLFLLFYRPLHTLLHREKGETLMIPNEVHKPSISFPRVASLMGGSRGRR